MASHRKWKTYGMAAAVLAAALLSGASEGNDSGGENAVARPGFEGFRPYVPAARQSYASAPEGVDSSQIVVKFRQRSGVRLREAGLVATSGGKKERQDVAAVSALLAQYGVRGIERLFTRPEEDLDAERLRGERNTGVELGDLNLYFTLDASPLSDAAKVSFINDLNALAIVETAYFAPVPRLAMITRAEAGFPEEDGDDIIAPASHGDYQSMQGYLDPAPNGIDALFAWTQPGGKGAGIKIIDVEGGWNVNHQDLNAPFATFGTNNNDCSTGGGWYDHGTAVLGEMVSLPDGLGTTGIAHESAYGISSVFGQTVPNAISKAAGALAAGDVILIELHYAPPSGWAPSDCGCSGSQCGYVPIEYYQAEFDAIANATANGIVVVEAAGNGSSDLDHPFFGGKFDKSVRDSGAIMVGAGNANTRIPACFTNFGSRLDAHGWGNWSVTTTGYGNLHPGNCTSCGSCPLGERNHLYTNSFAGTSSASPIVTGAVACVQGEYKARTGGVYTPLQVRQLLTETGTPQAASAKTIGPLPNLFKAICPPLSCSISVDEADVCYGTWQTFTASAVGGVGALSFAWDTDGDGFDDGEGNSIAFVFPGGTRTVRVRVSDAESCALCIADIPIIIRPAPYISGPWWRCANDADCLTLTAFDDFVSYTWSPGGETTKSICVAPSATTDYVVTVTDETGCVGPSAPFTLTVHPNPTPVISGASSRCQDAPCTTLDAGAGYASYLWTTGETGRFVCAAPATTADYAVTVTNAAGCQGASPLHTLTVWELPSVAVDGPTSRCAGNPCTTLTAVPSGGSGEGYTFFWSTGETTQSICVTETTTRTVTVFDSNGCSGVSSPHTLTEKPAPDAAFTHDAPKCAGEAVQFAAEAVSGGTQTLFSDDADGGLAGWTTTANVDVSSSAPSGCTGASAPYFRLSTDAASASMWRLVDTTGFADIRIRVDWRKQNLDLGECAALQYTVDGGSSWVTWFQRCSTSSPNGVWTCGQTSALLPSSASNNPLFGIRFAVTAANEVDEQMWVDRIIVEGTPPTLSYCWDFHGDGGPCDSTDPAPTYAYTSSGTPTARLTVSDGTCAATTTQSIPIDFCGGAPTTPVTGAAFEAGSVLAWNAHPEASAYDIYRGNLTALPQAGYCLQSGVVGTSFDEESSPLSGETWFYLVAARNPAGAGPLAPDGDGQPRTPSMACP